YRFKEVPEGPFALYSFQDGETPMAGLLTRVRFQGAPLQMPDMTSLPTVRLQGRLLPMPGIDVRGVHVCIPGAHACVHPEADSTYRFDLAPEGGYEIVFLAGGSAHYLAVEVGQGTTDTTYVKD